VDTRKKSTHSRVKRAIIYVVPMIVLLNTITSASPTLPDLGVMDIEYIGDVKLGHDELKIYTSINNSGNMTDPSLSNINVSLYVNGDYHASRILNLTGRYSSNLYGDYFLWIPLTPGSNDIKVVVDPNNDSFFSQFRMDLIH